VARRVQLKWLIAQALSAPPWCRVEVPAPVWDCCNRSVQLRFKTWRAGKRLGEPGSVPGRAPLTLPGTSRVADQATAQERAAGVLRVLRTPRRERRVKASSASEFVTRRRAAPTQSVVIVN
jgi:hypothetical protein